MSTEYQRDPDHTRHSCGVPEDPEWPRYWSQRQQERFREANNRLPSCGLMDTAWVVMLHEEGLAPADKVRAILPALAQAKDECGWGGEVWLKGKMNGDEELASLVNYGRTLQEPMYRMMMRTAILQAIDEVLPTLGTLLDVADANRETVMAGHSHWSHAQPTTYASYLLAVHEGLVRGLEQLELAYRHTNMNSGGCGACSGPGWPVNRLRITELLGFDETVEVSYDCEASQDNMLTTLFAASNIAVTLSRAALDFNVWVTEEWDIFEMDMCWRGVSSFMPQKANAGNKLEHIRISTNEVLGKMQTCLYSFKNEPIQDILPVYKAYLYVNEGLGHLEGALGTFRNSLLHLHPRKERMEQLVRAGYSGAPDLAIHLIRQKGYAGRTAHRICATMIRLARERGIAPCDLTGAHLDEAAAISGDAPPKISDAEVQESMSLEHFFEKHNNPGDPHPARTAELIAKRREGFKELENRHSERKGRLAAAEKKLQAAVDAILANA